MLLTRLLISRALETVHASHEARAAAVQAAAKEHAAGSGASDLRRLRRQFSSLKNTFCLYDTKENFIDGEAAIECRWDSASRSAVHIHKGTCLRAADKPAICCRWRSLTKLSTVFSKSS